MFGIGKKEKEKATAAVVAVDGNTTQMRVSTSRMVATVEHDRVMGTHHQVAILPAPAEDEEAIRRATVEGTARRYRDAAGALVKDDLATWVESNEALKEWRGNAAELRAKADQKRAAARDLHGQPGRAQEIKQLQTAARELELEAAGDDRNGDEVADSMNVIRARIEATLAAARSALLDGSVEPDPALAKGLAKLAAVLAEVMPLVLAAHAAKAAKGDMADAHTDFIDTVVPIVPRTTDSEAVPIAPPTRHPVVVQRPTPVRTANPLGGDDPRRIRRPRRGRHPGQRAGGARSTDGQHGAARVPTRGSTACVWRVNRYPARRHRRTPGDHQWLGPSSTATNRSLRHSGRAGG